MRVAMYVLLFALVSCGMTKNNKEQVSERVLGTVHLNYNNCPLLIEIEVNQKKEYFVPINLNEKFKVDQLHVKFSYILSKDKKQACNEHPCIELTEQNAFR